MFEKLFEKQSIFNNTKFITDLHHFHIAHQYVFDHEGYYLNKE